MQLLMMIMSMEVDIVNNAPNNIQNVITYNYVHRSRSCCQINFVSG